MKKTNNYYTDVLYLLIGEIIVSFGIVIAYVALGMYQWNILTGAILGSAVTVLNFLILSTQINKAIDHCRNIKAAKLLFDKNSTYQVHGKGVINIKKMKESILQLF